jgi:hypothetical protein
MPLIRLLITIAAVALIAWLLLYLVPMPAPFGTIIVAVAAIGCLFYAIKSFGVLDNNGP